MSFNSSNPQSNTPVQTANQSLATSAWRLTQQQQTEAALVLLEQIPPPEDLNEANAQAMTGASWIQCGQPERGLPYLNRDWSTAEANAASLAGAMFLFLGQIGVAQQALQRAVEGGAKDQGAAQVNLGRTLTLLNRAEEALPYLAQGLKILGKTHSLAARSHAEALITLGRSDEALASLPTANNDENTALTRAMVLATAMRHEEAAQALEQALTQWPASRKILLMAAELADLRGRSRQAAAMLHKALAQDPEDIALWARLAHTGRKGQLGNHARAAADQALKLSEGQTTVIRAQALNAHAHVLAEEGHIDAAETAYREILQLIPRFVPALSGLGHLLMQRGKVDEATQCFLQVRSAAPLQGWSQLIHAREIPEDAQVLENMTHAAHQPSLEGPVRVHLLFTLAAAWDKKKQPARAMEAAQKANEASKRLLHYQPEAHRKHVEREIARFSPELMATRSGWGSPSRQPVFVLGMPRSGTTLTEQILGSHSQVFGAGELGHISELIHKLNLWERHIGSGLTYPECVADMTLTESQRYAAQYLEALQQYSPDSHHIIDKLPHNFEHIGLIKLLFPNATIFHCQRESRDIALSNYMTDYAAKFGGMGFAYDLGWIGEQLVDHNRLMQHWHALFPGQIMEVIYEDLVEDTESWARRMIDFLQLPWQPAVLDFQELDRTVKTASVWQVRQPVYTTSKARWKPYEQWLEPLEQALANIPADPASMPVPASPPGLFVTAMEYLQQQEPVKAIPLFQQVLAAYPKHAAAHHFLGVALVQSNQRYEGLRMMRLSVLLLPNHLTWLQNLAEVEAYVGNTDQATQLNKRIATLHSKTSAEFNKIV